MQQNDEYPDLQDDHGGVAEVMAAIAGAVGMAIGAMALVAAILGVLWLDIFLCQAVRALLH